MATSIYTDETIYTPELWAREGLQILYENIGLRGRVHTDFTREFAEKGDTINTRVPAIFTAQDAEADGSVTSVQSPSATKISVTLDKNQNVTYEIRDAQQAKSLADLRAEFFLPAVLALIRGIEDNGISKMTDATNGFSDATDSNVLQPVSSGVTPATFTLTHIAQAGFKLDDRKVPDDGLREMCIAQDQLLDLITAGGASDLMLKANELGGESALRDRRIGGLFGFNITMQQGILEAAAAASGYPDAAVKKALFWHRNAVTYANRMLPNPGSGQGVQIAVVYEFDQALRVAIGYEILNKRQVWSLDAVWVWHVLRQEMGGTIWTKKQTI